MLRPSRFVPFAAALALPFASIAAQQAPAATPDTMVEVRNSSLQWAPLEIPGFRTGLTVAVLEGDPSQPGPYTVRLHFPAGYVFPAHWHPNAENLTVISGTFLLGMGARTVASRLQTYGPGDYLFLPGRHPHFGRVEGETVIQLHGIGPFATTAVEQVSSSSRE